MGDISSYESYTKNVQPYITAQFNLKGYYQKMNKLKKNILLLLCSIVIIAAVSSPVWSEEPTQPDAQQLIAQWQRADGNYLVDIKQIDKNGTLSAAYYNPKSINVSRAMFMIKNGLLKIFIELNDTGYPGSTYTLTYVSKNDTLVGEYFHAGISQSFDVVFLRKKD